MKKIMVVDDEPEIVKLLKHRLEVQGYEVITAFNGVEAFAKMQDHDIDLMILDLCMPMVDGYQLIKEMKWRAAIKDIPILVLSARNDAKDLTEALGVANFMAKPFNSQQMLDKVAACIRN